MKTITFSALAFAALQSVAGACNSSSGGSGGGGDGGAGGGASGGGSGTETFSCTGGGLCVSIDGPPSAQAGEQKACAMMATSMTFTVAPCATANLIACCVQPLLVADQYEKLCYYAPDYTNPNSLGVVMGLCPKMKGTWVLAGGGTVEGGTVAGDAGDASVGPSSFVGTWARSASQTVTCPTGTPTTNTIAGNLVITLGTASDTIVGTTPDGCATTYTVSGDTATASAGESCTVTLDGGAQETITVTSHTLTLGAGGTTISSTSSSTIDKLATGTICTAMSSGTFTKL
jgi:hypothetical protein